MMNRFAAIIRKAAIGLAVAGLALTGTAPAVSQSIETVDPNMAIDADLAPSGTSAVTTVAADAVSYEAPAPSARYQEASNRYANATLDLPPEVYPDPAASPADYSAAQPVDAENGVQNQANSTYGRDDLIGAAEGVFGKGAEGLARMIEDILEDQGEPTGYIVGREGGGAFIFGVRYGSGTLFHAVEGNKQVYWTGPSIGFDAGANAGNTFVLVYNLDDTEDLYRRYPAGEGQAYLIGGLNASYMRRGNTVLIPIRVGAGLRLGVNAGYMRFSRKQRWLPF